MHTNNPIQYTHTAECLKSTLIHRGISLFPLRKRFKPILCHRGFVVSGCIVSDGFLRSGSLYICDYTWVEDVVAFGVILD